MDEDTELWEEFNMTRGFPLGPQNPIENKRLVQILHRLVELGDTKAMVMLGEWYQSGRRGLPEKKIQAVRLFEQAANLDNAEAMFQLSICFVDGHGVAIDEKIAEDWFQKAKDAGFPCASSL